MNFMFLKDVLKNTELATGGTIPFLEISGLCCDSRAVKPGDVFFALPGVKEDGIEYVAEAVKRGASAVVCQSRIENVGVPVIVATDARVALAVAAVEFYGHPTRDFYLCGVTGTNGKTTLTYLLEKLWSPVRTGVLGTVNFRYADQILPATHTTPDSLVLQSTFSQMKKSGVSHVAMEVSSHALEQKRALGCDFDSAVFTNLTQDHLDYHQNMESYYQSKKILFAQFLAESCKKNLLAIINADDAYGQRLCQELKGSDFTLKRFSGKDPSADMSVTRSEFTIRGSECDLLYQGKTHSLSTNLIGAHNIRNIMAALLVGLHQENSLEVLLERCRDVRVPGRLERVLTSGFFVDYAHTPDAIENVMMALKVVMDNEAHAGRLFVVFGCGGDRDKTKRPLMGHVAARLADVIIVTSDNPRTENPDQIVADILPGVKKAKDTFDGYRGYLVEVDRCLALEMATKMAGPEDVVLVAGKGHEDYQIIGTQKTHFDDREILAKYLS